MQQSSGVLRAAPAIGPAGGHGVPDTFRVILRCLAVLTAAALAGFLAAALVPERYTSSAVLALAEGRGSPFVADSPAAAAAIIVGPDMVREAVARLEVDLGPGAVSQLAEPYWPYGIARWLTSAGVLQSRPPTSPETRAIEAFRRALTVAPDDGAGLLSIEVAAASPAVAARAANLIAQVYLERRSAALAERDRALMAATQGVTDARRELAEALDRAAAYRSDPAGADTARRAQAAAGDLSLLVAERAALVRERDAIARQLASVTTMRGSGNLFDAPFEGVHLLRHLVEQRLTLRAELAAESRIREARDWRVRALAARADDLDSQIDAATGSAHDRLISERDHLDRRIKSVDGAIHLRQAIIATNADNAGRQLDLDRAVSDARDRLVLARERLRDESARVRYGVSAARLLTVADAPAHPDSAPSALAGVVAALLAGFATWRLLERRPGEGRLPVGATMAGSPAGDNGSRPVAPVEDTRVASTATVASAGGSPLVSIRVGEAGDRALEALLARLAIAPRDEGGRHVAVVGTENDRASAAAALALARHLARRERVVLLDLATPGGSPPDEAASSGSGPGFADLIAGRASFAEIINREPGSRLHYVGRGAALPDQGALGDATLLALAALDQTYDWIVQILPASGNTELAGNLLTRAHGVVLVAEGETMDVEALAVYEALREKGISNIVVGLAGR